MTGYRCDSGACLHVETDGDTTTLWDTARPWRCIETSTASWRALLQAERDKERAEVAEEIARAVELTQGRRCPECAGLPASLKWVNHKRVGRCGAGHTWQADRATGQWRDVATIAREHVKRGASDDLAAGDE